MVERLTTHHSPLTTHHSPLARSLSMRPMFTLIRRECTAFFLSPIAYVVLVGFLFFTCMLFRIALKLLTEEGPRGAEWPLQVMFGNDWFWMAFAVIPPLITMRLF